MKKLNLKLEDYYNENTGRYDYEKIVYDFWESKLFQNKLDTVGAIMSFGKGKLLSTLVVQAFEKVVNHIDEYKIKYEKNEKVK